MRGRGPTSSGSNRHSRPCDRYLRGAPPGLPFRLDVATLQAGLNFTLTTDLGELDLLGDIPGGGRYADLLSDSETLDLFGVNCRCLRLDALIRVKRAAGRPKDFEAVAELEALAEERRRLPLGDRGRRGSEKEPCGPADRCQRIR